MRIRICLAACAVVALFAARALSLGNATEGADAAAAAVAADEKAAAAAAERSGDTANANRSAETNAAAAPPEGLKASSGVAASASSQKQPSGTKPGYSKIVDKNIFYPRYEAASAPDAGAAGAAANPQGSGLLLTGVVRAGNKVYVVIQNTGTGESSIVTTGGSTGAGQVVAATLNDVTLSTESGTFKISVGNYLSGAKGPEAAPESQARQAGVPQGAETARLQPSPQAGSQNTSQDGSGSTDANGRSPGGRRRFSQEQMDTFRNMTPEQRDQFRQSMRGGRPRRSDNGGGNQ